MVIENVADDLTQYAGSSGVESWPEDMLAAAAACFLMADAALKQWKAGKLEECLVTTHAAQQAQARFEKILNDTPDAR